MRADAKGIIFAFLLTGLSFLYGCAENHYQINQIQQSVYSSTFPEQHTKRKTIQQERPELQDMKRPATGKYYTNPSHARHTIPPIPDKPVTPPMENR